MKEMVGGCCVCSDDRGWPENPLVYCDGAGCTVAVHQACYGIVTVPVGNWYCRKCENEENCEDSEPPEVQCELCPNKDGALKRTDTKAWAHVVCALYIPEVRFGNVTTMEPIVLTHMPQERFHKTCYICDEAGKPTANVGACMQCNKAGCRQQFHVTCAQGLGLLCEEASNYMENVKYCGYCDHHYNKIKKGGNVKVIPPYRPVGADDSPQGSPSNKDTELARTTSKRKLSTGSSRGGKSSSGPAELEASGEEEKPAAAEGESSRDKISYKRRKGGSRTPPAEGASPDGRVRASSPGGSSSSRQGSTQQPSFTPNHMSSAKEPLPPTTTSSSTTTRPNSIVVTVPLEVLPPSVPGLPIQPSPLPSTALHTSAATGLSGELPPHLPAKRQRSQSSEKSEKGRRWMKRSSSGKPTSPSPQPLQQPTSGSKSASSPNLEVGSLHQQQQDLGEVRPRRNGSAAPQTTLPPTSTPSSSNIAIKVEKDTKIFQNGLHAPHMLGNQLNPSSTMAQKMCDTLSQEMVAHSVFTQHESSLSSNLVGPQLHRSQQVRSGGWPGGTSTVSGSTNGNVAPTNNNVHSSLEHLLERQWEQGSQFLMEQAQHFDIASLLSCLHQLRAENFQLEDHVTALAQRRDHLLAVNARLALPLAPHQQQQVSGVRNNPSPVVVNNTPSVIENGMATPTEQASYQRTTPQPLPRSSSAGFSSGSNQQHGQNTVVVRAASSGRSSSSSTYGNHHLPNPPHGNPHSNPLFTSAQPPQQQSNPVLIRRDVISELHHTLTGVTGGVGGGSLGQVASSNPKPPNQPPPHQQ